MMALTIWQPWAWCVIHGGKDVENRSWAPPPVLLGKRIAIHAAARRNPRDIRNDRVFIHQSTGVMPPPVDELVFGAVIGTVVLRGVVEESTSPWFKGPVGWVLSDPVPCKPVPTRGYQRLWAFHDNHFK